MKTQIEHIRANLEVGKTITPAQAIAVYGIFRLSSVIEDLRQQGMEVDCVLKWDDMGKKYGEYRMRQPIAVDSMVQVKPGHAYGLPGWVRALRSARVLAIHKDTALVRFIRGKNLKDIWMNEKELVNAS